MLFTLPSSQRAGRFYWFLPSSLPHSQWLSRIRRLSAEHSQLLESMSSAFMSRLQTSFNRSCGLHVGWEPSRSSQYRMSLGMLRTLPSSHPGHFWLRPGIPASADQPRRRVVCEHHLSNEDLVLAGRRMMLNSFPSALARMKNPSSQSAKAY